ncbi:hypothetical protein ABK040_013640 [Willaertia magna]
MEEKTTNNPFLLPQQFCGCEIKEEHWKFLIDKLSAEEQSDYSTLNVTDLFKLYSKTTLCEWIPNNLLLLNVFRYLRNKPLILIKLKETGGVRSQLNYYSLIMDDKYLDKMPIVWTGWTTSTIVPSFGKEKQLTFSKLPFTLNNNKVLTVENKTVEFNWNAMDGFFIKYESCVGIKLHELGDSIEFYSINSSSFEILEVHKQTDDDGCIDQKQKKSKTV